MSPLPDIEPSARDYRDESPLSDAIYEARREGEDNVMSWSSAPSTHDELDYAVARANDVEDLLRRVYDQAVLHRGYVTSALLDEIRSKGLGS